MPLISTGALGPDSPSEFRSARDRAPGSSTLLKAKPKILKRITPAWLVFAVGAALALVAFSFADSRVEESALAQADGAIDDAAEAIRNRVQGSYDVVLGAQGLFRASDVGEPLRSFTATSRISISPSAIQASAPSLTPSSSRPSKPRRSSSACAAIAACDRKAIPTSRSSRGRKARNICRSCSSRLSPAVKADSGSTF